MLWLLQDAVERTLSQLDKQRSQDFVGQLLWQQQFRATEFMSRWYVHMSHSKL